MRILRALNFIVCLAAVIGIGCRDDPDSSEESARRAWQVVERAQDEAHQANRLRDVDRAKCERDKSELAGENASLTGLSFFLVLLAIAVLYWLAVEVRRRRTWTHVAHNIAGVPEPNRSASHLRSKKSRHS